MTDTNSDLPRSKAPRNSPDPGDSVAPALLGSPAVVGLLERNQGSVDISPRVAAPALRTFGVRLPSRLVRQMVPATQTLVNKLRRWRLKEVGAEQEHRKGLEDSFAIETFATEATRKDGYCPVCGDDAAQCAQRHEAEWRHAVNRAEARLRERQAEPRQHTAAAKAAFLDEAEEKLATAYDPEWLKEQEEFEAKVEARCRGLLQKAAERRKKVEAHKTNRLPAEGESWEGKLAEFREKERKLAALIPQAAERRLLFGRARARRVLMDAEQRRQATPAPPRICLVCDRPVREGENFDSDACQRKWRSLGLRDGGQSWARRCLVCNRWFRSSAPTVSIVADDFLYETRPPRVLEADICSRQCWAQVAAVAPEPLAFRPVEYPGPPPQLRGPAPRGGAASKAELPGREQLLAALARIRVEVGPSLTPEELLAALQEQEVSIPNTTRLAQVMADVGLRTKHRKAGKSTSRSYNLDNLPADGETS